jgi:hypothetical protein
MEGGLIEMDMPEVINPAGASGGFNLNSINQTLNLLRDVLSQINQIRGMGANSTPAPAPLYNPNMAASNNLRMASPPANPAPIQKEIAAANAAPEVIPQMNFKIVLNELIPYLEQKTADNPNITIGQCIAELPQKAADILALLKIVNGGMR